MKRFQTLLIALFIGAQAFAQAPVDSLDFQDYLSSFKPARGSYQSYKTLAGADSLFAEIEAGWAAYPFKIPGPTDLRNFSARTTVLNWITNGDLFSPLGCRVAEKYILSEWLDRLDTVQKGALERSTLVIYSDNVLAFSMTCDIDPDLWERMKIAKGQLPATIEEQLQARAFPNPRAEEGLKKVPDELKGFNNAFMVKDLFVSGEPDSAYAVLSRLAEKGLDQVTLYYVYLRSKGMLARGEKVEAFRLLDVLAADTSPDNVVAQPLGTWYAQVDPVEGPARFARVKRLGGPTFIVTESAFPLDAVLEDAVTGKPFDLRQLQGKSVVVDFWWSGCPPCLAEIPELNAFNREIQPRKDVVFLSILSDAAIFVDPDLPAARQLMKAKGVTYLVLVDNARVNLTKRLNVSAYPSKFLVNLEGRLVSPRYRTDLQISLPEVREYLKSGSVQGTK